MRRTAITILILLSLPAILFSGMDRIKSFEQCPLCRHEADVVEYRFFGCTFRTEREYHPSIYEFMLRDLGRPCEHAGTRKWRRQRWWGLVYCKCPCVHIEYLMDDAHDISGYDKEFGPIVRAYAKMHPSAGRDLWQALKANDANAVMDIYYDIFGSLSPGAGGPP